MMTKITRFPNPMGLNFYAELRRRVNEDFARTGTCMNANALMWGKMILFLSTFTLLYFSILLSGLSVIVLLGLTFFLGTICAFIGFNVCHDAIHGSFSANKKINKAIGML